jgi:hypothetical protein
MVCRNGVLLLVAVMVLGALVLSGCGPAVVPKEFNTYVAKDESFQCEAPAGWEVTGGGKNSNYNATFSSGGAVIKITFDVTGSVLGDIAKNQNRGDDPSIPTPLEQMHEMNHKAMAENLSGFKDLSTDDISLPIGKGKKSEFQGDASFGGQQHGYRITSLLTSQRLTVICQCPEAEWQNLQPVFDRVVESIKGR